MPKTTYTQENTPQWIHISRQDEEWPYTLEIELVKYDDIRLTLDNVKFFHIDLPRALLDTGLTVPDVYAIIGFLRYGAKYVTFTITGHGTVYGEIILPQGVEVVRVRNARGEIIQHTHNTANNSIMFMVELSSTEQLIMTITSMTTTLTQILPVVTSTMIAIAITMQIIRTINKEVTKWLT